MTYGRVAIFGGIYSGVFTPTESSAVAGLYVMALSGLVYRELGMRQLYEVLSGSDAEAPTQHLGAGERSRGAGRPSKRERRLIDRFTEQE